MADQKLTDLTEVTAIDPTDLAYLVNDVGGTPTSKKASWSTLLGGSENIGGNLIRNSPGQIVTDGAEPQWWDEGDGNATLTDEDAAGEACEDKTERVFKCVTIANDKYGLQTLTFADEDLLDAGQTVVSLGCWIWCAAATKASIGLYGTNLGLQESAQHSGGSSWEYFSVENITLDAADADIEVRLIVDTGTAFYTMPMLCVGPVARPWVARDLSYVGLERVLHINTTGGDVAWSDSDCTANTDPLAVMLANRISVSEPNGTLGSYVSMAPATALVSTDQHAWNCTVAVLVHSFVNSGIVGCDDGQLIRYTISEADADNDVTTKLFINGYWRWA
jgi:hypothetical protein